MGGCSQPDARAVDSPHGNGIQMTPYGRRPPIRGTPHGSWCLDCYPDEPKADATRSRAKREAAREIMDGGH